MYIVFTLLYVCFDRVFLVRLHRTTIKIVTSGKNGNSIQYDFFGNKGWKHSCTEQIIFNVRINFHGKRNCKMVQWL